LIGLILDGYVTEMGFRVRKSDETEKNEIARQWIGQEKTFYNVYVTKDEDLLIVRGPGIEPSVFDVNAFPA
jgi:hypothetical protein